MEPLVSCILPTRDRADLIGLALHSFQSQTYFNRELVVVDNGADGTDQLISGLADPRIHYWQVDGTYKVGAMRNLCCERAQGEIICHFDSDDWSAPTRVEEQVKRLQGEKAIVTGYNTMLFYDQRNHKLYKWLAPPSHRPYALGTSLCYLRSWWQNHPFQNVVCGEDFRFVMDAVRQNQKVASVDVNKMQVARVHGKHTSGKSLQPPRYQPLPINLLPEGFRQCVSI